MTKLGAVILAVFLTAAMGISQEPPSTAPTKSPIPEDVKILLDGVMKTKTGNDVFNITFIKDFYYAYPQAMKSTYTNIVFKADLDNDVLEIKKMFDDGNAARKADVDKRNESVKDEKDKVVYQPVPYPETFHRFYLRLLKGDVVLHDYFAPIPAGANKTEFYSCSLDFLEPGSYQLIIYIKRSDKSKEGIRLVDITVPKLTLEYLLQPLKTIEVSICYFFREVREIPSPDRMFTVVRNCFQHGGQLEFYPYLKNEFKVDESPLLNFFVFGAKYKVEPGQPQPKWDVEATIEIFKDNKKELDFPVIKLESINFSQFIQFKSMVLISTEEKETGKVIKEESRTRKSLVPGAYTLEVSLKDNISKNKGKLTIPFTIVG